jgi:FkbM family methyltransferase
LIKNIGRTLFKLLPPHNQSTYKFCSRYVDRFNGDNNSDPTTNGEYRFLENELAELKDRGCVFDVGSNVGNWTEFALSLSPRIVIHCFEPSEATFGKLMEKRWPSNVVLNNVGLGEVEGTLDLYIYDERSGLNSLYQRRGINQAIPNKKESVKITTIDNYCERNEIRIIDLIKVDVEGHELAVFKGMSQMLERGCVRRIQFEYGGCNLDARVYLGDIWEFLDRYGFNFYKIYPDHLRHVSKYHQTLETFKYSNWVCIKEGLDS